MKKILYAAFMAFLTLGVLTSCSKEGNDFEEDNLENVDFQKEIIGTWRADSYVWLFNEEIISEFSVAEYKWDVTFTKDGLFYTSDGYAGGYAVEKNRVWTLDYEYVYRITNYDGKRAVCKEADLDLETEDVDSFDINHPVDTFKGQKIYKSSSSSNTFVYLRNGKTPVNCYTGKYGKGVYYEEESVVIVRQN